MDKIRNTTDFLIEEGIIDPEIGIILGTGLSKLVDEIRIIKTVDYAEIPDFPISTVESHHGKLIYGEIDGKKILAMQGRFHYYEGYTMKEVTFPVRVMKALGVHTLLVSNASGGTNPSFSIGDLMILNDHINLFPDNPLIGRNYKELGPRFPDMSKTYDRELINKAFEIAAKKGIKLQQGVYAGLSGPCFETPAEYKYVRVLGADAVGMSTVPEVIVARHSDMRCFAISIITDLGVEGKIVEVTHQDVIDVAAKAEVKMTQIMKELISVL